MLSCHPDGMSCLAGGEMYFIFRRKPSMLLVQVEIQQNSNVTYRLGDYGRLGADGQPALCIPKRHWRC